MIIDTIISAVSAGSSLSEKVARLITSSRGPRRSLLLEIKKNLGILEDYYEKDLDPEKTINVLEDEAFTEVYKSSFSFRDLQRKKITKQSCLGIKSLEKYIKWDTERLVTSIYLKIDRLKKLVSIGYKDRKISIVSRLYNLFKQLLLLVRHIDQ